MTDIILEKFFEMPRWEYAIDKGVGKDISRRDLCQLAKPEIRAQMYQAIKDGKYEIAPPHTAQIPKDNGEFGTVYVNEPMDRILLSIANDLLFELTPEMIHSRCKSYQKGTGCGKIVQEVSKKICDAKGEIIGWKSDLSKYLHSVPSARSEAKYRRYFRALPEYKLSEEDMLYGQHRDITQLRLELFILISILQGALVWEEFAKDKWFWQSSNYPSFIILKQWIVTNNK